MLHCTTGLLSAIADLLLPKDWEQAPLFFFFCRTESSQLRQEEEQEEALQQQRAAFAVRSSPLPDLEASATCTDTDGIASERSRSGSAGTARCDVLQSVAVCLAILLSQSVCDELQQWCSTGVHIVHHPDHEHFVLHANVVTCTSITC